MRAPGDHDRQQRTAPPCWKKVETKRELVSARPADFAQRSRRSVTTRSMALPHLLRELEVRAVDQAKSISALGLATRNARLAPGQPGRREPAWGQTLPSGAKITVRFAAKQPKSRRSAHGQLRPLRLARAQSGSISFTPRVCRGRSRHPRAAAG